MEDSMPSYLRTNSPEKSSFEPPVPERSLEAHSAKLVFSTRLFPEWFAAVFGILRTKYNDLPVPSASELIQLALQDYIKQNYSLIKNTLPPTEASLEFLLQNQFINPNSERQLQRITKISELAERYEQQVTQSGSFSEQLAYWRVRDPERAKAMEEEAIKKASEHLSFDPPSEKEQDAKNPSLEEVISDNSKS